MASHILLGKRKMKVDEKLRVFKGVNFSYDDALHFHILKLHGEGRGKSVWAPISHNQINSVYVFCNRTRLNFFFEEIYSSFINKKMFIKQQRENASGAAGDGGKVNMELEESFVKSKRLKILENQTQPSMFESAARYIFASVFDRLFFVYNNLSLGQLLDRCEHEFYSMCYAIRIVCNNDYVKQNLLRYLEDNMVVNDCFHVYVPPTTEMEYLYDQIFSINSDYTDCLMYKMYRMRESLRFMDKFSPLARITSINNNDRINVTDVDYMTEDQCVDHLLSLPIVHIQVYLNGKTSIVAAIVINIRLSGDKQYHVVIYDALKFDDVEEKLMANPDLQKRNLYLRAQSERQVLMEFVNFYCNPKVFPNHTIVQSDYKVKCHDLMIRITRYDNVLERFYKLVIPLGDRIMPSHSYLTIVNSLGISRENDVNMPQTFEALHKDIADIKTVYKNLDMELFVRQQVVLCKMLCCALPDIELLTPMQTCEMTLENFYRNHGVFLRSIQQLDVCRLAGEPIQHLKLLRSGIRNCTFKIYRKFVSYLDFKSFGPSLIYAFNLDLSNILIVSGVALRRMRNSVLRELPVCVYNFDTYQMLSLDDLFNEENVDDGNGIDRDGKYLIHMSNEQYEKLRRPPLREIFTEYLFNPDSKNFQKKILNALVGCFNSPQFKYQNPQLYIAIFFFARRLMLFLLDNIDKFYKAFKNGPDEKNIDPVEMFAEWYCLDSDALCVNHTVNVDGFLIECCRNENETMEFVQYLNKTVLNQLFAECPGAVALRHDFSTLFFMDAQSSVFYYLDQKKSAIVSNSDGVADTVLDMVAQIFSYDNDYTVADLLTNFNVAMIGSLEQMSTMKSLEFNHVDYRRISRDYRLVDVIKQFMDADRRFVDKVFKRVDLETMEIDFIIRRFMMAKFI